MTTDIVTMLFAFYGRVSTEDMQDPVASRLWQLQISKALLPAGAEVVAEFFDVDESRALPWQRRPEASRLLAALADPNRGFNAVVIGEPARAFHGNQYGLTFPLFPHYGVDLWVPEVGGRIDPDSDAHDMLMQLYGGMSKGERNRTRVRVRSSMASQTEHQGRFLGGRPPYGYLLARACPHPNPRKAAEGAWLYKLERDPDTAWVVLRIYTEYAAGRGLAAIARGLDADGIPCPSAHDRVRNPHRAGTVWRDSAVRAILTNPRYGGHQVWGRAQRSEVLLDPADVAAGPKTIRRSVPEDAWLRSTHPSHEALVPCELIERVQTRFRTRTRVRSTDPRAARAAHATYPLRGVIACARCGRRMQGENRGGRHYYRCPTSGSGTNASEDHPVSVYLREDAVISRLDDWLAEAFSAEAAVASNQQLAAANLPSPEENAREAAARRSIAEADRKIARLEQALDNGLNEGTFIRLTAKHETDREAARAELRRLADRPVEALSPEQFRAAMEHAGKLAKALAHADDRQRQRLYEALGVEISYDPTERVVHALVSPRQAPGTNSLIGVNPGEVFTYPLELLDRFRFVWLSAA